MDDMGKKCVIILVGIQQDSPGVASLALSEWYEKLRLLRMRIVPVKWRIAEVWHALTLG